MPKGVEKSVPGPDRISNVATPEQRPALRTRQPGRSFVPRGSRRRTASALSASHAAYPCRRRSPDLLCTGDRAVSQTGQTLGCSTAQRPTPRCQVTPRCRPRATYRHLGCADWRRQAGRSLTQSGFGFHRAKWLLASDHHRNNSPQVHWLDKGSPHWPDRLPSPASCAAATRTRSGRYWHAAA